MYKKYIYIYTRIVGNRLINIKRLNKKNQNNTLELYNNKTSVCVYEMRIRYTV